MKKNMKDGAEAYLAGISSSCKFMDEIMQPQFKALLKKSQRDSILLNIYYRIYLHLKGVCLVNQLLYFQTIASTTRSVFELLIDLKLIIKNKIPDAIKKYNAFTIVEKARVAQKSYDYYSNQKLKSIDLSPIQKFLNSQGNNKNVNALITANWGINGKGNPKEIKHWSGRDVKGRADLLDNFDKEFYIRSYPMLSWYIHSAAGAGIVDINEDGALAVIGTCYKLLLEMFIEATFLIGNEFHINKGAPNFKKWLKTLDAIPGIELLKKQHPELNVEKIISEI